MQRIETGNYYYGARYYDPKISVWLSVDPLAQDFPHLTSYNFTENNAVMLVDPDGRSSYCPSCPKGDKRFDDFRNSNELYTYNSSTDEVTWQGGMLAEVVVIYKLTHQERGEAYMRKVMPYSMEDARREVYKEKGFKMEHYDDYKDLGFPDFNNLKTSHSDDLVGMAEFLSNYSENPEEYGDFAKDYVEILFSEGSFSDKLNGLNKMMEEYSVPEVTDREVEQKFYELNPKVKYLEDE